MNIGDKVARNEPPTGMGVHLAYNSSYKVIGIMENGDLHLEGFLAPVSLQDVHLSPDLPLLSERLASVTSMTAREEYEADIRAGISPQEEHESHEFNSRFDDIRERYASSAPDHCVEYAIYLAEQAEYFDSLSPEELAHWNTPKPAPVDGGLPF